MTQQRGPDLDVIQGKTNKWVFDLASLNTEYGGGEAPTAIRMYFLKRLGAEESLELNLTSGITRDGTTVTIEATPAQSAAIPWKEGFYTIEIEYADGTIPPWPPGLCYVTIDGDDE